MKLKATDESTPGKHPQLEEDPEEQGLRILAKFIARKLEKSRRDKRALTYGLSEDDGSAPMSTNEDIS